MKRKTQRAGVVRRYLFRLYPSAAQEVVLTRMRTMCGELWNACVQRREDVWRRERRSLSAFDLMKEMTVLRNTPELPEWGGMPANCMEAIADRLQNAYSTYFAQFKRFAAGKREHMPKPPSYRRSADYPSIPFKRHRSGWRYDPIVCTETRNGVTVPSWRDGRLYVRGVPGLVKVRGQLPCVPAAVKMCDLLWREGRWHLSVVMEMPPRRVAGDAPVGVALDLIQSFARVVVAPGVGVSSDGGRDAGDGNAVFAATPARSHPSDQGVNGASVPESSESGTDRGRNRLHGQPIDVPESSDSGLIAGFRSTGPAAPPLQPAPISVATAGAGPSASPCSALEPDHIPEVDHGSRVAGLLPHSAAVDSPEPPSAIHGNRGAIRDHIAATQKLRSACKRGSKRSRRLARLIARQHATVVRRRREQLHEWTTAIQRRAASIRWERPPSIAEATASGRGDARAWGAEVAFKAMLNRRVLSFAPAMALQFIEYKAAEAGCPVEVVDQPNHPVRAGAVVVAIAKTARRIKRRIKA